MVAYVYMYSILEIYKLLVACVGLYLQTYFDVFE